MDSSCPGPRPPDVLALGQAVLVNEDLLITGLRAPEIDAAKLLHAVEIHVGLAATGIGPADQPDLIAFEVEVMRAAGLRCDVQFVRPTCRRFPPSTMLLHSAADRQDRLLRVVALDDHVAAAVVADGHDAVAVGQRLDGEALIPCLSPGGRGEPRQRLAIGGNRSRLKCQPQHVLAGGRGVVGGIGDPAFAYCISRNDRRAPHDVVLAIGPQHLRLPGQEPQGGSQRPGMGQVEPIARDHDAAVDAVLDHAGFVGVVGREQGLPAGHLPRPGAIGQQAVAGKACRQWPWSDTAATCRSNCSTRERPSARVNAARRRRIDAGTAEKQRQEVPHVGLPIRERLAAVHHVVRHEARHMHVSVAIFPVPEVVPERGIAAPLGQQDVAEVFFPGIAGLRQRTILPLIAKTDHVVEELQDERNAARLPRVPLYILGIGVAVPGRLAGAMVAVPGQQIGPRLTASR